MSTYLGPACGIGEHTERILAELGYSAQAIGDLLAGGVIGSGRATATVTPEPIDTTAGALRSESAAYRKREHRLGVTANLKNLKSKDRR
jgi:hypothetical protein